MNEGQFTAVVQSVVRSAEEIFWAEVRMPHAAPRGYQTVLFVSPTENFQGVLHEVLDWSNRQGKQISWDYQLSKKTTMKQLISGGPVPATSASHRQDLALAVIQGGGSALSLQERTELQSLEEKIHEGLASFVDVGRALIQIRDSKLFREGYKTFEDYVADRWGMSARHAYRLVDGAQIVSNLLSAPAPDPNVTSWSQPPPPAIPTAESQVRPLKGLEPEHQKEVWAEASAAAGDSPVTARHVEQAREQLHPRKEWPKPNSSGVYEKSGESLKFTKDRCFARIDLLQLSPQRWAGAASYDFRTSARSSPITAQRTFCTREDALEVFARELESGIKATLKSSCLSQANCRVAEKALEWIEDLTVSRELSLEVQTLPEPAHDSHRVLLAVNQLINDAGSLLDLVENSKLELSTKELLHLSVALTHLKNFRNSVSMALDPKPKSESKPKPSRREIIAEQLRDRWVRAKASGKNSLKNGAGDELVIYREGCEGPAYFLTSEGGWSPHLDKAQKFRSATEAKLRLGRRGGTIVKFSRAKKL